MVFNGASMDAYQASGASPLAMLEKKQRSFLGISWGEIKLLAIAGVGFFMDAYDLFIINIIYAILLGESEICAESDFPLHHPAVKLTFPPRMCCTSVVFRRVLSCRHQEHRLGSSGWCPQGICQYR